LIHNRSHLSNVDAIFPHRSIPVMNVSKKRRQRKKDLVTGVRLKYEIAGGSLHQMRLDSGIINAASGQNRLNGAHLGGFILDVYSHGEGFTDVDAFELDEIELHVFFTWRWKGVESLRHLRAAHCSVQGQSFDLGTYRSIEIN